MLTLPAKHNKSFKDKVRFCELAAAKGLDMSNNSGNAWICPEQAYNVAAATGDPIKSGIMSAVLLFTAISDTSVFMGGTPLGFRDGSKQTLWRLITSSLMGICCLYYKTSKMKDRWACTSTELGENPMMAEAVENNEHQCPEKHKQARERENEWMRMSFMPPSRELRRRTVPLSHGRVANELIT
ncbi:hypothetical protein SKAU_G00070050 [Synaphobranchus kaupii]|uniref:Uncharacterized protein n=1 Tax=Synaphobranchus kaupii TaxID=118154 RepID=A0A9Q1JBM1_SYNKA|nr:hypothetical protein SKAU_G00070050 [Synaphobranchus kaupii]